MNSRIAASLLSLALAGAAAPASAQNKNFADANCPEAVTALKTLAAVQPNDAAQVVAAAENAERAYVTCANQARSNGAVEPLMHYDQVRAAQYEVLAGRAYLALKRWDEAHAAFADAKKLSAEVYEWTPPSNAYRMNNATGTSTGHNSGNTHSQYRDAASDVMKAADEGLAKLVPAATPTP